MRTSPFKWLAVMSAAICAWACPAAFAADAAPAAAEPKFWKESPDQAQVLATTFIGGKGHEWLVGGGFQADGTIVLVGNVAGPTLEFSVPVGLIGNDLPAPPEAARVPAMEKTKAGDQQKLDKEGKPVWEKPSWRHAGVTGFVLRCSADLKQVKSAHRLPWASGAITSVAIGKDGGIYIAGRAGDGIANVGGAIEEWSAGAGADRKDGSCDHAFIARLAADGSKVDWARHSRGLSDAPQVALQDDGTIRYSSQAVWSLDSGGKLLKTIIVPGGVKKTTSVSPTDGSMIVAGEHHWPTGREPWRCPIVNVHNPDGQLRYQLYDWGGPYVGLDNLRQVSDSAIRFVTHDRSGNVLLYAWSDGGNSVMVAQPNDVRSGIGLRGLGMSTAGAGVLSCAYLIRLEPKEYRATAWTLWLGMSQRNKPNSVWIDNLAIGDDGTICMAGRSAWGLWQTPNKLSDAPPEGEYIAVLNRELDTVRFCSVIPGAGVAEVSHDKAGWGIGTGIVAGRRRALFVGSAAGGQKEAEAAGAKTETPTVNAMQSKFGGGWSDGYVVMLDLGPVENGAKAGVKAEVAVAAPVVAAGGPTSASFERGATGKSKKAGAVPADGTAFLLGPDVPKWVTVDAEFRDRGEKRWPTFLYGKPVEGTLKLDKGALQGTFVVACPTACQPKGDQSRRVLGELFQGEQPPQFRFTLESLGKLQSQDISGVDRKGKPQTRTIEYCEGKGTLELGGRKIAVTPKITFGFGKAQGIYRGPGKIDQPVDAIHLNAWLTMKAADLGLKAIGNGAEIDIRIGVSGIARPAQAN